MTMSTPVAEALADCIHAWWLRVRPNAGDCRVVVPSPTPGVARGLHEALRERGLLSYLVTSGRPGSPVPSEEGQVLRAEAVTSVRDGSFVAVVEPGVLSKLQESIQGSGGGIRSLAIPDEWPWTSADAGFDFFDDFFPRWLNASGYPDSEGDAAKSVLELAIAATEPMKNRAAVLFDEVLSKRFDRGTEAWERADSFAMCVGIPSLNAPSADKAPGVPVAGVNELKYVDQVVNAMQETNARDAIEQNSQDALGELPEDVRPSHEELKRMLNDVLSRLRTTSDRGRGALGLRRALPSDRAEWRLLTLAVLRRVFVHEPARTPIVLTARWDSESSAIHVFDDGKHCVVSRGSMPMVRVSIERQGGVEARVEAKAGRTQLGSLIVQSGQQDGLLAIDWGKAPSDSITITITATAGDLPRTNARIYLERTTTDAPDFILVATTSRDLATIKKLRRINPGDANVGEESVDLDEFTTLYAISSGGSPHVTLDGIEVESDAVADGVKRLIVDAANISALGSQPELVLANDEVVITVPLSADGRQGGPCNLEVALAESLRGQTNTKSTNLLKAWYADFDARPLLGSPDEEKEKRFKLVSFSFEHSNQPWRPVVLTRGAPTPVGLKELGLIRVAKDGSTVVGRTLETDTPLSTRASDLVERYAEVRRVVLSAIDKRHGDRSRAGLPLYAAASFDFEVGDDLDRAVSNYLASFESIQQALKTDGLTYVERFVLAYLDAVVVTIKSGDGWQIEGCSIGPWHPLVVAKRLMVGRGLRRLAGFGGDVEHRWLRKLGGLLQEVTGFRWFTGLGADSAQAIPLFVDATDDPGWLVAQPANDGASRQTEAIGWERELLGVGVLRGGGAGAKGVTGYLTDFFRAFPSKRSIVVKVSTDTVASDAAAAARAFLTQNEQPTRAGTILRGGVHIIVDDDGGRPAAYPGWDEPVVCVYPEGGKGFLAHHKIDMFVAQAASSTAFPIQPQLDAEQPAPRGTREAAVLQLPLRTLEETGAGVRDSRLSYNSSSPATTVSIGPAFSKAVASAQSATGPSRAVGVRTLSPGMAMDQATWTVLPGDEADPAVLLDWARASTESGVPKLLWDYRMAITQSSRTYFVLSEVPRMLVHHIAGSTVFGNAERAGRALLELASIGLALGSETFKSNARALGVVGLIGAARVAQKVLAATCEEEVSCCYFLLPIDSFGDLLGGDLETPSDGGQADYRRGDLIGVACRVAGTGVELAFCAVESKYCGGGFSESRARAALGQAARSLDRLTALAQEACEQDALAERLALARLLEFGLRLDRNRKRETIGAILSAVLRGEHRAGILGKTGCLVVSTEISLTDSSVLSLDEGVWVRLASGQWPDERGNFDCVEDRLSVALPAPWKERSSVLPKARPSADPALLERSKASIDGDITKQAKPEIPSLPVTQKPGRAVELGAEKEPGTTQPLPIREATPRKTSSVELLLGVSEDGKPVVWRAGENSNHNFMITGSSGLGKTQLLKSLLLQARQQGLPALVLDFKNDFASDREFLSAADLEVQYVSFDGLPYNPLIPSPQADPRSQEPVYLVSQHLSGIVAAFQRTYGLGEQQAADLKDSIRDALEAAGVASSGIVQRLPDEFPDFAIVGEHLRERNRLAYNRLDPLFDLEIFRDKYRDTPFDQLLGRGYVLDLSGIQAEHIQNTLAMLLVYSGHRYLNSLAHAPSINQLLVFDEAHRVLRSEDVERLVRECRAYGLGVVLSSQYPTDFPADTAANLAAKVLHGNGPDIARVQAIRSMLGLSPEMDKRLNLPMFNAVTLARPNQVVFARTIGYPHRILMEALREGPLTTEELRRVKGLHGDRFEQTLQHLAEMRLVSFTEDIVELAS